MRLTKSVAFTLAGIFLVSLLAAQAPLASPEIPVSSGRDFPTFSQAAMAADGSFVVVWQARGNNGPDRLWMRRFAANGKPRGREVLVGRPAGAGTQQTEAKIAMRPDGGFMIVWESGNVIQHSVVFGRSFGAGGKPLGPAFRVDPGDRGPLQFNPDVAAAPDGSFLVAWASGPNPFGQGASLFARRFSGSGTPLGDTLRVASQPGVFRNFPRVAVSGNGDFLVAWFSSPDQSIHLQLLAQRFDAGDRAVGEPFRVTPDPNRINDDNRFAMALRDNGESLFVWIDTPPDAPPLGSGRPRTSILAQRVAPDGTGAGGLAEVHETEFHVQEPPALAASPGGGYFVAWRNTAFPYTVFGQRLASDGAPQGPELRISGAGSSGLRPSLTIAEDGHGVVTWTGTVKRKSWIFVRLLAL
jgi:hypothetical protein